MFINSLSYGVIIPLLYPYAQRFGLHPFGLSLLFVSFSIAQFIATPIIGRLSDRYGRRPLLLFCLLGSSLALAIFASAQNVFMLFAARALDGITGGNNSVAQAVIADSTEEKDRAKSFGILGAAFGFGLLFGPALGGFMSQFGLTAPFWFASAVAMMGTVLGVIMLPETLRKSDRKKVKQEGLFHVKALWESLLSPSVGIVFVIMLLSTTALQVWVLGFQAMTNDVLLMSPTEIGGLFTVAGIISIFMQAVGIRFLLKKIPKKRYILTSSLALSATALFLGYWAVIPATFVLSVLAYMLFAAPQNPILTAMLSGRSSNEDQGGVMGLNQSYISLGQIIGPLIGGTIASRSVPLVMIVAAAIQSIAVLASFRLYQARHKKYDL